MQTKNRNTINSLISASSNNNNNNKRFVSYPPWPFPKPPVPVTPKLQYTLHIFYSKTSPDVQIQLASIYVHKSQQKNHLKIKKNSKRLAHSPVKRLRVCKHFFPAWETKIALNKSPRRDARVLLRCCFLTRRNDASLCSLFSLYLVCFIPTYQAAGRQSLGTVSAGWFHCLPCLFLLFPFLPTGRWSVALNRLSRSHLAVPSAEPSRRFH